ncbi:MAG: glycoside hydrolase family 2 TIM barrel-domain containing protein [Candidatus Hadarchaeales archaeon]
MRRLMFFLREPDFLKSLNGRWKFRTDGSGRGVEGYSSPDWDDSQWGAMRIPTNWHLGGLWDYHGRVWFRRKFNMRGNLPGYATLRFNGVDYACRAWLNGKYLGSHEGYFAPFEFNVTNMIRDENTLAVEVDSPWEKEEDWPNSKRIIKGVYGHHDCRPGGMSREGQRWNTGGIWNSVELVLTGQVKIDSVRIHQKIDAGLARLRPRVVLRNLGSRPTSCEVVLRVGGENFRWGPRTARKVIKLGPGEAEVGFTMPIPRPRLWWQWDQGTQNLYFFEVEVREGGRTSDRVRGRFGIRRLKVDRGWNWFMNGRRFFPRGTNVIHSQWLSEMNRKKYERDLRLVRECNVNFIRVHAHVEREELYQVADEMGILVWQDFPLQWSYDDSVASRALPMMREMIHTFFNHPSIVVWCCHNEPQEFNLRELDLALYGLARKLDDTRYVHLASEFREHPYPGWYHGDYHMYVGIPGCPCPTEFGAQALMNLESMRKTFEPGDLWPPNWSKWAFHNFQYEETFRVARVRMGKSLEEFIRNSQEYQSKLLKFAVENYRRRKYTGVTGIFQFMFVDPWPAITWSVVDYYRRPKKGYFTLKKVYSPIYIILTPPREEFSRGAGFFGDFTVVNDLPKEFRGARYRWYVKSPSGKMLFERRGRIDIPADGVVTVYPFLPMETVKIPEDAEVGEWKVFGAIEHGGRIIARNEDAFVVVPRKKIP